MNRHAALMAPSRQLPDEPNLFDIPDSVKPYLDEIGDRLWSGHAAVMVGAGFSKNINSNTPEQKTPPDWNQLGDIFLQKLNPESKTMMSNIRMY